MEDQFPDIFLDDLVQDEEENPDDDKPDSSDYDDMQVSVLSASSCAPRNKEQYVLQGNGIKKAL